MPVNRDFIGRSYATGETYEVSRVKIAEFADAIGDANPIYRDPEAARAAGHPDVIAPPTFAIIVSVASGQGALREPGLGLEILRVVHGEQRFVHHQPMVPGMVVTAKSTIEDIRVVGRNEAITLRAEVTTLDGAPVCDAYNVIISRGTAPQEG